jgi:hypothetical protein
VNGGNLEVIHRQRIAAFGRLLSVAFDPCPTGASPSAAVDPPNLNYRGIILPFGGNMAFHLDATGWRGGDLDVCLHAFSYEPMSGYANEIRSDNQLRIAIA